MTDEEIEEPLERIADDDIPADPKATLPAAGAQLPPAIGVAGARPIDETPVEPEDVEPQKGRHPDNDGETVEQ